MTRGRVGPDFAQWICPPDENAPDFAKNPSKFLSFWEKSSKKGRAWLFVMKSARENKQF